VTVVTSDNNVSSSQGKVGLQVVVECPRIPGNRVVAVLALVVEVAAVWILFLVTRNTVRFGVAE
jgi:hypothetical protein